MQTKKFITSTIINKSGNLETFIFGGNISTYGQWLGMPRLIIDEEYHQDKIICLARTMKGVSRWERPITTYSDVD